MFAARAAAKKGPQLREKSWGPGGAVIRGDSKRRMNAACCGVCVFIRHRSLLHHSRDSLRTRFIPTSLIGHVECIASLVCRSSAVLHYRSGQRLAGIKQSPVQSPD